MSNQSGCGLPVYQSHNPLQESRFWLRRREFGKGMNARGLDSEACSGSDESVAALGDRVGMSQTDSPRSCTRKIVAS